MAAVAGILIPILSLGVSAGVSGYQISESKRMEAKNDQNTKNQKAIATEGAKAQLRRASFRVGADILESEKARRGYQGSIRTDSSYPSSVSLADVRTQRPAGSPAIKGSFSGKF